MSAIDSDTVCVVCGRRLLPDVLKSGEAFAWVTDQTGEDAPRSAHIECDRAQRSMKLSTTYGPGHGPARSVTQPVPGQGQEG